MDMPEPYGYITEESELRFILDGGNKSRGTVPLHRKKSKVSKIPLFTLDQLIYVYLKGKEIKNP